MSSGKSTRFFYIFIITLVVGGILIFLGKLGVLEGFIGSYKPLITPDELCEMANMNIDDKAGMMYEKGLEESEDKSDNTLYYKKFDRLSGDLRIWLHINKNENSSDYFWLNFVKTDEYTNFVNYVKKSSKIDFEKDKLYTLSSNCLICNQGFTRQVGGYTIFVRRK